MNWVILFHLDSSYECKRKLQWHNALPSDTTIELLAVNKIAHSGLGSIIYIYIYIYMYIYIYISQ